MSAKVILPDFRLPGEAPRPAVRALWVAGGMMVVATFVLGAALWHRHSVEIAAQSASAKVAAVVAQQQQLAAEPARPAVPAPTTSPVALAAVAETTDAPTPAAVAPPAPTHHRAGGRHHRGAHSGAPSTRTGRGKALAARGVADGRGSKNSSAKKKDDAIDQLLKQFK